MTKSSFRYLLSCIALWLLNSQTGTCQPSSKTPLEYVYKFPHTSKDPEQLISYFREDQSIGLMQIGYHFYDPFWVTFQEIPVHRSGELFAYFHTQLVARYDLERISVGLPLTIPFDNIYGQIAEAYFPTFPPNSTKFLYYGRPENVSLKDIPGKFTRKEVNNWWKLLNEAIDNGYIIHHNGTKLPIYNTADGLELLAHSLISTGSAPNHARYGCYHTGIHTLFGKPTDPNGKYFEYFDIALTFIISTMDPVFFRFHKHMVSIFAKYKFKLDPYTKKQLGWETVKLHEISVLGDKTKEINKLTTFTQQWKPVMSHGFDLYTDQPISVLFHILNHEDFNYNLKVENLSRKKVKATVRLLLLPIKTSDGANIPFEVQRKLAIEMDKFKAVIAPGVHNITHHSSKSWVTIPLERSTEIYKTTPKLNELFLAPRCVWPEGLFKDPNIQALSKDSGATLDQTTARKNCGWAHHLQIPRGNRTGVYFAFFAMLTNWEDDKVRSVPEQDFSDASAYCGVYNDTYPDKRAMGFPFDRRFKEGATLKNILLPNMAIAKVKIFHSDKVVPLGGTFEV